MWGSRTSHTISSPGTRLALGAGTSDRRRAARTLPRQNCRTAAFPICRKGSGQAAFRRCSDSIRSFRAGYDHTVKSIILQRCLSSRPQGMALKRVGPDVREVERIWDMDISQIMPFMSFITTFLSSVTTHTPGRQPRADETAFIPPCSLPELRPLRGSGPLAQRLQFV